MASIISGNIFILSGTSSTGKSSIIKMLKENDPSWVEMGPDLAGFLHMGDLIKSAFPKEYAKLSEALDHTEIAHAIVEVFYKAKEGKGTSLDFIRWKNGIYSKAEMLDLIHRVAINPAFAILDQSMYASETAQKINQKMIDFICAHSKAGRPVFVDGMDPTKIDTFKKQTEGYPVKVGLAYLPLHHLVDRVTKRNETAKLTGDDSEVRSYKQITEQFLVHYAPAQPGELVVGYISLRILEAAFGKMQPKDDIEKHALKSLKIQLINEFDLSEPGKVVALKSRIPFQVLVETRNAPQKSVERILTVLR